MSAPFLTSVTRISDLNTAPFDTRPLDREYWDDGDYVIAEIVGTPSALYQAELASGRIVQTLPGDFVIGAFGHRAATLEGVGSWTAITDTSMHALTGAGLFGKFTSLSPLIPRPMALRYHGHITRRDTKVCMHDFAITSPERKLAAPVVLVVGTSMSAGKTTTGRLIVHELASLDLKVIGTKLTGAGRYRDILSFRDAGAEAVFDFVDAGLPSTVIPEPAFRSAIRPLLSHIASREPDVVLVEAGASPLEPYNGAAAIDEIHDQMRCTVLCASDPYAVVGVQQAFGLRPDLVTGPAANTTAGIALVKKLSGVDALNGLDPDAPAGLRRMLEKTLAVKFPANS